MKWGKRKSRTGKTVKALKTRVKQELNSLKRERQWKEIRSKIHKMTTKEINSTAQRIQMENDLKRLSRNRQISSSKDRQDYLNRGKMSNQELSRKVSRLRARDNLNRVINDASKEQMELGKKIVNTAGPLAFKKMTGQRITTKDITNAYKNPKQERDKIISSISEKFNGNGGE